MLSVSGHEHMLHCVYLYGTAHWRSVSIACMRQNSTISTWFLFNCIFNLHLVTKAASGHDLAEPLLFHLHPYLRKCATKKRPYRTPQVHCHWKWPSPLAGWLTRSFTRVYL